MGCRQPGRLPDAHTTASPSCRCPAPTAFQQRLVSSYNRRNGEAKFTVADVGGRDRRAVRSVDCDLTQSHSGAASELRLLSHRRGGDIPIDDSAVGGADVRAEGVGLLLRAARCNRMPAMLIKVSLLLLALGTVMAQETRSTIVGRVTDASGAVVAGAAVNARNTATGVNAAAKTNESGNFTLPYLLPGPYRIQAELQGFKKFSRDGIELRVNESVEVNISLEIGATTETVEVKADTPLLQTVDASLGQVVDQRRIQELPSFGSSPMTLVQLAPGVINSTDMRLAKAGSFSINKNSQFSTDGAGQYNNEFTLDGVSNTQAQGTSSRVGFIPPQTAVGEFKVQTAPFDASVGHTIGSLVNVSTRSGTNSLHGELYWWLRNSGFFAVSCG